MGKKFGWIKTIPSNLPSEKFTRAKVFIENFHNDLRLFFTLRVTALLRPIMLIPILSFLAYFLCLHRTLASQSLSLEESSTNAGTSAGTGTEEGGDWGLFSGGDGAVDSSSSGSSGNLPLWGGVFDPSVQSFTPDFILPPSSLSFLADEDQVGSSSLTQALDDFAPIDTNDFISAGSGCDSRQQAFSKKERKKRGDTDVCSDGGEEDDSLPILLDPVRAALAASKSLRDNPCDQEDEVVCCPENEEFNIGSALGVRRCKFFFGVVMCLLVQEGNVYCCGQVLPEPSGTLDGFDCVRVR